MKCKIVLSIFLLITLACGWSKSSNSSAIFQNTAIPPTINISKTTQPEIPSSYPALTAGDTTKSLLHNNLKRNYVLHIPRGYDPNRPTPVVIVLHGYGLNAQEMMRITGFNSEADRSGFIVVFPEGSGIKSSWNGGTCCGEALINNTDDVGFIRTLLAELAGFVHTDAKRVYATGFSNGAIMAYRLACDLSEQIAAIAPVSATQSTVTCQPNQAVSVIHFHGTADKLNPYEGKLGADEKQKFTSVKDTIQLWVAKDECLLKPLSEQLGNILHDTYTPCMGGTAIELYTVNGGEHAWPGGESVSQEIGKPTQEILATELIWKFFAAHPKP